MGDKEGFPTEKTKDKKLANKDKKLLSCLQTVKFGGEAAESHELCCTDVRVVCGPGSHTSGSSKVKLRNIVDFNWDLKTYPGQLIAVHIRGNFFAYGLKTMGKGGESPGSVSGMVRVVSRATGQRALIRGLRGMVQDLAFSHLQQEVVLACVDQQGVLLVHRIEEKEGIITCTLLLHVEREEVSLPSSPEVHRVVWCPYIPEEGATINMDSEVGQLLVLTRGPHAEMWCVPLVNSRHGPGPLFSSQVTQGLLRVPPLDSSITDAAFSPDGTALAIASAGGLVSFFQVYMHNHAVPRCLHSWRPHGDKPLTTLFFLDNHRDYNPDIQFWKWAVTGARDNSEIKLWACESWTCLQTLNFEPCPGPLSTSISPSGPSRCILKAALDLSSRYLVLSDIYNRMLYVLQLQLEKGPAHVSIVSGFTLPQPAMSFGIFEAGLRAPCDLHERPVDGEEEDGEVEFEDEVSAAGGLGEGDGMAASSVVLRMFVVQPKSLQECRVAFKPDAKPPTLSHETLVFREESSAPANGDANDIPTITTAAAAADLPANHAASVTKTPVSEALNTSSSNSLNTSGGLNLMTPEAFSSPARHEESPSRSSNVSSSGGSAIRSTHTPPLPQDLPAPSDLKPVEPKEEVVLLARDGAMASGGSSPSREVQQILALQDNNGDLGDDDDFFEDKVEPPVIIQDKVPEAAAEPVAVISTYDWPQIPLLMPMEEAQPQLEQLVSVPPAAVLVSSEAVMQELREVRKCLQTLTIVIEQQQSEIKDLRGDVNRLGSQKQKDALEASTSLAFERILTRQLQRLSQVLDTQVRGKLDELRESLAAAFAKSADSIVSARLNQSFSNEVQTQLVPAVLNTLQPLQEIMQTEVVKMLTASDKMIHENLSRLANSKSVQETLAASMTSALQKSMAACFREVMLNTLVPGFEKTCKTMFMQMDDAFARGTREHLASVEAQLEKHRQRQVERSKDTSSQILALSESVRIGSDATANMVRTELHAAMAKSIVGLHESVSRASREAVVDAMNRAMREQQNASMRASRPETPQPRADPQAQMVAVLALVAQGQLNSAFQQALSASDLGLVVKLCERVNPQQVFNQTPCPLQQPVLLSLIQQLAADLNSHTELKAKYLEEAVMNLDSENTITREHMPAVLLTLQKQLSGYIQANPNHRITRSLRMLLMATHSLIKT